VETGLLEPAALVIAAEWSLAVRPGRYSGLGLYLEWGTAEYDSIRQRGLLRDISASAGASWRSTPSRAARGSRADASPSGSRASAWLCPGRSRAGRAGVSTDVDVTFDPVGEGTLVRLEQTGFEHVPDAEKYLSGYDAGWKEVLG
jgi:hypothetical protein